MRASAVKCSRYEPWTAKHPTRTGAPSSTAISRYAGRRERRVCEVTRRIPECSDSANGGERAGVQLPLGPSPQTAMRGCTTAIGSATGSREVVWTTRRTGTSPVRQSGRRWTTPEGIIAFRDITVTWFCCKYPRLRHRNLLPKCACLRNIDPGRPEHRASPAKLRLLCRINCILSGHFVKRTSEELSPPLAGPPASVSRSCLRPSA